MPKLNLQKRERIMLLAGTVAVVLMLAYGGARGPWQRYQKSVADLKAAAGRFQDAQSTRDAVVEARRSHEMVIERVQQRGNFDLWTFLNEALRKTSLVDRADMQSRRGVTSTETISAVQLTLQGVSLEELVKLLHVVYAGNNLVVVHSLDHLRPGPDNKGLECRLVFVSPEA